MMIHGSMLVITPAAHPSVYLGFKNQAITHMFDKPPEIDQSPSIQNTRPLRDGPIIATEMWIMYAKSKMSLDIHELVAPWRF